jgi:hypothetical protein
VDGTGDRRFERRDRAAGRGQLRLGARRIELGAAAGVEPRLGEVESRSLVRDVTARDVELLLLAAQLEVRARDFGGHGDERVAPFGFDGAELRIGGLEAAANAAEEIELPDRIEAGVVELGLARCAGLRGGSGGALLCITAARVDRRQEIEGRVAAQGAGRAHARLRDAQVVIGRECLRHEILERRVMERLPELADVAIARVGCGLGVVERVVDSVGDRRCRCLVVGAHGTGRQKSRGDGRRDEWG